MLAKPPTSAPAQAGAPLTAQFLPPKNFSTPSPTASMLIDVNGDGLDDWVYSDGTNIYVLLNTGTGWEPRPSRNGRSPHPPCTSLLNSSTTYYDRGIRFLDINGDGLPDFVRSYASFGTMAATSTPRPEMGTTTAVFLNTGNGWATSTAYTLNPITAARHEAAAGRAHFNTTSTPTSPATAKWRKTSSRLSPIRKAAAPASPIRLRRNSVAITNSPTMFWSSPQLAPTTT